MNNNNTDDQAFSFCPFANQVFPWPRAEEAPLEPPPWYAIAREQAPLHKVKLWDGNDVWIVTRMQEFREIMTSPYFSADPQVPGFPFVSPARGAQSRSYRTFITMDPPDHGHYRRMLTKEFMVKRMLAMRPDIEAALNRLLDEMEQCPQPVDFIEKVALPLPSLVISIMLGVPYEDHAHLQAWSADRQNLNLEPERLTAAARNMERYISDLLHKKEQDPSGEDLLSRLAAEWINPGHLSHQDAVQMGVLLYLAGHETTANLIGLGLVSLLMHPEQMADLIKDSSLAKGAAEEMLRYHSITHMNSNRVATADVMIGDTLIRQGEGVLALLHAANHDPMAFTEPGRFDIHRDSRDESHVAFSFGIHQCLGQPLARLELQVVFEVLFRRFPNLQLAVPFEEMDLKRNVFVFGLNSLPVTW